MNDFNLVIRDVDFSRLMALHPPSELRAELDRAIVVPGESIPPGVVVMGSRVCYCDQQTGNCRDVELVFPEEADPSVGKVSVLAPVGAALIGLGEGQEIDWEFPDGSVRRLTVVAVTSPASEHSPQH